MKKFLKRALPIVLAVALIFTLSAGAFAEIKFKILGKNVKLSIDDTLLKIAESYISGIGAEHSEDIPSLLKTIAAMYEESGIDQAATSEELLEKVGTYAAKVAGVAGTAIATGDIIFPTYIDVVLPEGTTQDQIVAIKKGMDHVEQLSIDKFGIEIASADVPGLPDSYSFFDPIEYDKADRDDEDKVNKDYPTNFNYYLKDEYGDPVEDQYGNRTYLPFIRIYNYDTGDITVAVLLNKLGSIDITDVDSVAKLLENFSIKDRQDGYYLMVQKYSMGDAGLMSIGTSILENRSLYEATDPNITIGTYISASDEGGIYLDVKGGFSYLFNTLKKQIAKQSFLEFILG